MEIEIVREDHEGDGCYRLLVDGTEAGELEYRRVGEARAFTHTGVREAYEGQGLAAKLASRVLADARAEGVLVVPRCPYVRGYIERHPEHQDLVAS